MSYTRFNYDVCRTNKLLQESTDEGRWVLNKPGWGNKPYYFEDPHIRLEQWGANLMTTPSNTPIDIDSDLSNRTRREKKYCSQSKYPNTGIVKTQRIKYPVCKAFTQETRASHPSWMYRDLEQTRWEYPLLNPQENVCLPFHNNLSTRILEKDYYVPKIPCIPEN